MAQIPHSIGHPTRFVHVRLTASRDFPLPHRKALRQVYDALPTPVAL